MDVLIALSSSFVPSGTLRDSRDFCIVFRVVQLSRELSPFRYSMVLSGNFAMQVARHHATAIFR